MSLPARTHRARRALAAALVVTGVGAGALVATRSDAVVPDPTYDIRTNFTVSGDLVAGNVVTLNIELQNAGTNDYPYNGTAWLLLPRELKRTNVPLNVLCEAYRGHQGGLSQAVYNDYCHWSYTGPIPAGGSVSQSVQVKLLSVGTWPTVTETATGTPYTDACCIGVFYPNLVRKAMDVTVAPAPPKVGGGGGGGGGTALPDLQAGAKASTGSPAIGTQFSYTFTEKNVGKVAAVDTIMTATIDPALVVDATQGPTGTCAVAANVVTCDPVGVPAGGSVSLFVTAHATSTGTNTSSGSASSSNGDANPANNTASVAITVK